jgi:hypothetical protein
VETLLALNTTRLILPPCSGVNDSDDDALRLLDLTKNIR